MLSVLKVVGGALIIEGKLVQVTIPLLKFVAEFVLNKSQRLTFDSSSPNGILLFREVSKLTVAYGSRILSLPNRADMYTFKYKGIGILLSILSRGTHITCLFDFAYNCILRSKPNSKCIIFMKISVYRKYI